MRGSAAAVGNLASRPALSRREKEILGLLAEGMSGAQIANKLVLSPETVRTHVRNAMAKLGASTRSQAVVLALQNNEITRSGDAPPAPAASPAPAGRAATTGLDAAERDEALRAMLDGLVSLYDVDRGAVYLADEDGLSLVRAAVAGGSQTVRFADEVALGDGPLGRAALDRRAQLVNNPEGGPGAALLAAPMIGNGRLLGVIALATRVSRPVGRSETLLLQAFANRAAEVLVSGQDVQRRLERAMERFRVSWSAANRGG